MSKFFFEDYSSNQGKVLIPDANHVGIELEDGTIIELSEVRKQDSPAPRARLQSHDPICIEPSSSNSAEIGQAVWSRAIDEKTGLRKPSDVNDPPGFKAYKESVSAIQIIEAVSRLISSGAIHTKTKEARENLAGDLAEAAHTIRKGLK